MAGKFGLDPHRLEDEALELAGGCGRSRGFLEELESPPWSVQASV
jgi:hypothetical protein